MYKFDNKKELLSFMQEKVLTAPEVIEVLGVSKTRVSKMIIQFI